MVLVAEIQDIEEKYKGKTLNENQRHLLSSKLGLWPWVPNEIKQLWEEKILCFLELFSFAETREEFPTDDIKLLVAAEACLPVSLNEITWTITDKASRTNRPPVIAKTISCLVMILTAPSDPPNERDPVSPINIFAGGALNHKKPKQAPIMAPQKSAISPVPSIYVI